MSAHAEVVVTSLGRPPTMNSVLGAGKYDWGMRGRIEWRDAALADALTVDPKLRLTPPVKVTVTVLCADRRRQDLGAAMPAAKAIIDGIVLAKWIPDDEPQTITELTFTAHQTNAKHGIKVKVEETI